MNILLIEESLMTIIFIILIKLIRQTICNKNLDFYIRFWRLNINSVEWMKMLMKLIQVFSLRAPLQIKRESHKIN